MIEAGGDAYEVRVRGAHDRLTLGDVLAEPGRMEPASIDGMVVSPDARFSSVVRTGSRVSIDGSRPEATYGEAARTDRPAGGRTPFNRPPRSEFPMVLPPLSTPHARETPRTRIRFGWAALVVPVVLGVVLAIAIHPRMALFAVFSPVMAAANWIEERRRSRKGARQNRRDLDHDLMAFRDRLVSAMRAEGRLRQRAHPSPAVLIAWVEQLDTRLWERRRHHSDLLRLGLGTACVPWVPELTTSNERTAPEALALIDELAVLHDVPIAVTLEPGSVVGITGDASVRRAVARSLLLQLAVLHGPSDVEVAIATDHPHQWDWAKWLPHVLADAQTGRRRLAAAPADAAEMLERFARDVPTPPVVSAPGGTGASQVLIVDVDDLAHPAHASVRAAIERAAAGAGAAITCAATLSELSSRCTVVVDVDASAGGTKRVPEHSVEVPGIEMWTVSGAAARRTARILAGVADPDLTEQAADLSARVRLVDLLGMPEPTPSAVGARWESTTGRDPSVPVGALAGSTFEVNLVRDGPHALLAGTTGSGKSEFLRSLVASMAATSSPADLTFVLVDYKGGSAFDVCAKLPHTVGLVTDLDGHLAQRALTCLEAELRHREERLRAVGASDLIGFRVVNREEPLPRLFVVVDEFAAVAKELPEFMASLIDIAQRGRSLGVHLLLATQRPQGVINDQIRANTNLRIALRVQDAADSSDVIGTPAAAQIGRTQAGRGYVRLGAGDVEPFQAALVTRPCTGPPDPELVPFVFAAQQPEPSLSASLDDGPTDLAVLVGAVAGAFELSGVEPPRRPWPDPLPTDIPVSALAERGTLGRAAIGLADEPGRQRQRPVTWGPSDGNLLLYGVAGSGTTTALTTTAVGLAETTGPDDLHLYVLDFDDQLLAGLDTLTHTGGVVGAADRERQLRLIRMLRSEIDERRAVVAADPEALASFATIVLIVDNYAGFSAAFDEPADLSVKTALSRVIADGPGVGVVSVISAKQPVDVPAQIGSLIPSKLLFRLADRYEYAGLGVSGVDPPSTPGRCYESWTGRELQIARAHRDGAVAAAALVEPALALDRPPAPVEVLPAEVKVSEIVEHGSLFDLEWMLPVGLGDAELMPAGFRLGEGDHVVVSGPARSGKSTVLATVAEVAKTARPVVTVVAVAPRRSPLRDSPHVDVIRDSADELASLVEQSPVLLLVDDATMVDDVDGVLAGLVDRPRSGGHVIAAALPDLLRSTYGHWTAGMRRSRIGLAMKPNPTTDGDLWQTPLPRRGPERFPAGRGYLVAEGQSELVQVASG